MQIVDGETSDCGEGIRIEIIEKHKRFIKGEQVREQRESSVLSHKVSEIIS